MNTALISAPSWLRHLTLLSYKGALLALALGLVLLLLRRHVSPAWRHGLWLLVLLRFALPDIGTSSLSLHQVAELPALQLAFEPQPVAPPYMPLFEEEPLGASIAQPASLPSVMPVVVEKAGRSDEPPVVAKAESPPVAWTTAQWLFGIWLVGVVAVLGVMLTLHLRLLARLRRDATEASVAMHDLLQEACELAGISRRPRLIVTNAVRTPALFGVLNPAILLPRELVQQEDAASLKLVFLHELAHLRRQDLWAQIATSMILALHWFNPVVWWAARRLRAEAEMAADARALASTNAGEAYRFGTVLLSFASRATAGWMLWLAAATVLGISENKHDLRRRIEALKDIARGHRTRWIVGMAAFLLLALTGLTKAPAQTESATKADTSTPSPTSKLLTVSGMVVDEAGKPIAGAKCALSIQQSYEFTVMSGVSGADGRFTFERVPLAASLSLSASHKDYAISGRTQFNSYSEPADHRIVLPSFTWVTGRVTDQRTGKPVKDARVFYGRELAPVLGTYRWFLPSVRTSETGEYRLPIKTADTQGLIIRAWAQDMTSRSVLMDLGQKETTYDVALEPVERIPGTVVNGGGIPVKDAFVWVIEDRLLLDERKEPLTAEWLKSKDKRKNLAEGKMFISLDHSKEGGAFNLHAVDPLLKDRLWVAAIHPDIGIGFLRAKDLKPGVEIRLAHWAAFDGLMRQDSTGVLASKEIQLMAGQSVLEPSPNLPPGLNHYVPASTDPAGLCRVRRILPNCSLTGVQVVGGDFHTLRYVRTREGELGSKVIALHSSSKRIAPENGRVIRGRIVMPGGRSLTSSDYTLLATVRPESGSSILSSINPDAEGRFVTDARAPGVYGLTVMIMPRQKGMMMASKAHRSLRFMLEQDAEKGVYELPDIVLDEGDFAFEPLADRIYEVPADGGFLPGQNGRVDVLAVGHDRQPLAKKVRVQVVDFVDPARQPLGLKEVAGRIPAVTTDAQSKAVLTFPRSPAPGVHAAGVLVQATGEDGGISREAWAMDGAISRMSVWDRMPIEVQVNPAVESWIASSWGTQSAETPAIGGTRLHGGLRIARDSGFLIRGRQADGRILFSGVQKASAGENEVFRKSLTLTPGVNLEGTITPVTAGQKLDGWIAASVNVKSPTELGEVIRGLPTGATWLAWAPVREDGSFVLKDLPNGRVSLLAMGLDWACAQSEAKNIPVAEPTVTRLTTTLDAQAFVEQRVKILLPDGSPVAAAVVTKNILGGYSLPGVFNAGFDHAVASESAAAYASFKKAGIPGQRCKADSQGEVSLTHLLPGMAGFQVFWLDAKTQQPRHASFTLTISAGDTHLQIVKLTEVRP